MKPRPRIRKTIKWVGAAVTVLLVGVWILNEWPRNVWVRQSSWWRAPYWWREPHVWRRDHIDSFTIYFGGFVQGRVVVGRQTLGWSITNSRPYVGDTSDWYPFDGKTWFIWKDSTTWAVGVPLWVFIALWAFGTARVWRLDHCRARLNLCPKCNYDRAGIRKDAVCPECGSEGGLA
jgi:hypothetical protein